MTRSPLRAADMARFYERAERTAKRLTRRDRRLSSHSEEWTAARVLAEVAKKYGKPNATFFQGDDVPMVISAIESWGVNPDDPPF